MPIRIRVRNSTIYACRSTAPLHNGILYGFFDDDWFIPDKDRAKYPHLDGIPLGKIAKKNWKKYEFFRGLDCFNFRHSIGHGCIWISAGPYRLSQVKFAESQRFELPSRNKEWLEARFVLQTLRNAYVRFYDEEDSSGGMARAFPVNGLVGYGCVPKVSSCKSYLIYRKTKKFGAWDSRFGWDIKTKNWEVIVQHENFETFYTAFLEDFYFFVHKNDYYFVTESGRLFYAPPRESGEKSRIMRPLWDGAQNPITAANRGRRSRQGLAVREDQKPRRQGLEGPLFRDEGHHRNELVKSRDAAARKRRRPGQNTPRVLTLGIHQAEEMSDCEQKKPTTADAFPVYPSHFQMISWPEPVVCAHGARARCPAPTARDARPALGFVQLVQADQDSRVADHILRRRRILVDQLR